MAKVSGIAILRIPFVVDVPVPDDEFECMTQTEQMAVLDAAIDWLEVGRNGELDDIEIYDVGEDEVDE